jgi:hypothetical protein
MSVELPLVPAVNKQGDGPTQRFNAAREAAPACVLHNFARKLGRYTRIHTTLMPA